MLLFSFEPFSVSHLSLSHKHKLFFIRVCGIA